MKHWKTVLGAVMIAACASEPKISSMVSSETGRELEFVLPTPSGELVSSQSLQGRVTLLLLVTSFDLPSQLVARRVNELLTTHRPRINALGVALEAPKNAPLVEVFRNSLGLRYQVTLADQDTLMGAGPFGRVSVVPTLIVMDRRGREVARTAGVLTPAELEQLLSQAEQNS